MRNLNRVGVIMLNIEDIHIKEIPVESADLANGNGRKFLASVQKVWTGSLSNVVIGTPMEDRAEAELCVELNNTAMLDIYDEVIRGFGEVVRVAKEHKAVLPDEMLGAIEVHHDLLESAVVMTKR
jgi:hypothetical protein